MNIGNKIQRKTQPPSCYLKQTYGILRSAAMLSIIHPFLPFHGHYLRNILQVIPDYAAALLVGRSWDRFPVVPLGIFSVVPSYKTMCPEVDSAYENE